MKADNRIVNIDRRNKGINIWISLEDISDLAERHPNNPLKILDMDKFVEEYLNEIKGYELGYERNGNAIEEILEECIQKVYEAGSDTVKAMTDPETGESIDDEEDR